MDILKLTEAVVSVDFSERLIAIRKRRGFTQKGLAEAAGLSQIQVHRYENGSAKPTLEAIRRLAITLSVTTDELVFDDDERGPSDDLKLQFEAISTFDEQDKAVARTLLDSLILRNQSKRWIHREETG